MDPLLTGPLLGRIALILGDGNSAAALAFSLNPFLLHIQYNIYIYIYIFVYLYSFIYIYISLPETLSPQLQNLNPTAQTLNPLQGLHGFLSLGSAVATLPGGWLAYQGTQNQNKSRGYHWSAK